jgi:MoxR-like ATPase
MVAEPLPQILAQRGARRQEWIDLDAVTDATQLLAIQDTVEQVHAAEAIERYIVSLTTATRQHPQVQVGVSPRGTLALYQLARAQAMVHERDFVLPDDVKAMAIAALAHRLLLKPELWVRGGQAEAEHASWSLPASPAGGHTWPVACATIPNLLTKPCLANVPGLYQTAYGFVPSDQTGHTDTNARMLRGQFAP